ncbi:hypothetical protein AB4254_12165 [Vibrio breoganii]
MIMKYLRVLLPSMHFRGYQLVAVNNEIVLSFSVLIFLGMGLSQQSAFGYLALINIINFLSMFAFEALSNTREGLRSSRLSKWCLIGISVIAWVMVSLFLLYEDIATGALWLSIAVGLIVSLRDLVLSGCMVSIGSLASREKLSASKMVAILFAISAIVSAIGMVVFGFGVKWNTELTVFVAVSLCSLGGIFCVVKFNAKESSGSRIEFSRGSKLVIGLNTLQSATSFVGRRVLVPFIVIQLSVLFGLESESYTLLGIFLAVVTLFGFVRYKNRGMKTSEMVTRTYYVCNGLWFVVAALTYAYINQWLGELVFLMIVGLLLCIDVAGRFFGAMLFSLVHDAAKADSVGDMGARVNTYMNKLLIDKAWVQALMFGVLYVGVEYMSIYAIFMVSVVVASLLASYIIRSMRAYCVQKDI